MISFWGQSLHKECFEKLLLEWSELRYSAAEWLLLNHKMQIQWWIVKVQKNTKWSRKLVRTLARIKRVINNRDDFFLKACSLSAVSIKNDHNLKFFSFEFLKLSAFLFSFINQAHWIFYRSIQLISFYIN